MFVGESFWGEEPLRLLEVAERENHVVEIVLRPLEPLCITKRGALQRDARADDREEVPEVATDAAADDRGQLHDREIKQSCHGKTSRPGRRRFEWRIGITDDV